MSARKCRAKSKRTGQRCRANAIRGRELCYHHGGRSPRGVAHPNFKTGQFSIDIPARYYATTSRSVESPESRKNRVQIGLLDARSEELLGQLSTGESGGAWTRAAELLGTLRSKLNGSKQAEGLLDDLDQVIGHGIAESRIWSEILVILAERRRMVETDSRIAFRQSMAISHEQAATLVAIIVAAAKEFITDPVKLQAFADRIEANTPGGVRALARGTSYEVL